MTPATNAAKGLYRLHPADAATFTHRRKSALSNKITCLLLHFSYISIVNVCLLSHMMEDIEVSLKLAGESTRPASSPLLSCLMGHFLL